MESYVLQQQDPSARKGIDPMFYVRVLVRRRWLILAVLVAAVLGTAVYGLRQKKVYQASASVIIDVAAPRVLDNKEVQDIMDPGHPGWTFGRDYIETQIRVITSRAVAERVVEKLALHRDSAFLGLDGIKDEAARAAAMQSADAVSILQQKISVKLVTDSRIVLIVVNDYDPKRAALLANEVAEAYIAESLGLKLEVTDSASSWLEDQLAKLEERSKRSELGLYEFRKQADMLSMSLEDRVNLVSQRLGAVSTALTTVELEIAALKARVDALNELKRKAETSDPDWADAAAPADGSEAVDALKTRYVSTRMECADLRARYLENHPSLIACNEKLQAVQATLLAEVHSAIRSAQTLLDEATRKRKNLMALQEATKAEAFEVNRRQIEYERLKREAENDQRLYDVVLKRLKDIELSSLLRTSNVRILDKARPNYRAIKPNLQQLLLMAGVLGLMAGFALALLVETIDNTVSSQRDIEENVGLPFLGLVPRIDEEKAPTAQARDLHVHLHPKSSVAECCRSIRTNLLFMSPDKPLRTMVVTSSGPQEGKSTTVISLGIAMAQSGQRILLLDTDMRRPRLHRAFGVPNEIGVSSLLVGEGNVEDAIKSTEIPNLFVIPCGPVPPNPAELLHTQAFRDLLAQLSGRFDRIVLDSPPLGAVADAAVLATQVDGALMVLKAGRTRRDLARRSVRALADVNARVFGAILNNIDLSDPKYGEYYAEYRRYGYYYGEKKDEVAA